MMNFEGDDFDDDDFDDDLFLRGLLLSFLSTMVPPTPTIFEPSSLQQLCVDHLEREKMPKTVDSAAHLVAALPDLFYNPIYKGLAESVRQFLFARATWLLEKYNHQDLQDRFGDELFSALVNIEEERTMALKRMASFRTGKLVERTTAVQKKNILFDNDKNKSSTQTRILRLDTSNTNVSANNNNSNSSNSSSNSNTNSSNTNSSGSSSSNNSSNSNNNSSSNLDSNIQQHPSVINQLQVYYTLNRLLQGMIWPDGVDPAHREQFLSPSCFFAVFGMTKNEFSGLKHFVQVRKKKEKSLF